MSQTINSAKLQKLTVKNRTPGCVSTGANTQVFLDDVPLKGVSFLKLEFKAAKVAKVTMEMFVDIEVEADVLFEQVKDKGHKIQVGDKIYVLTEYMTIGVVSDKS